uniref:Uncharacterized protein n=1 Tax=Brassica oleracea TaxID=3712 RepID=A0A3P6EID9_BRAOL|nr:unnamed protein product [Brassica oleracea]
MSSEYRYSEDIPTIFVVGIPVFSCSDAESEYHAWFETNRKQEEPEDTQNPEQIENSNRCMIDRSWTHDTLSSDNKILSYIKTCTSLVVLFRSGFPDHLNLE